MLGLVDREEASEEILCRPELLSWTGRIRVANYFLLEGLEERLIHEHRQGQRHLAGPFSISICGENGNGASGWAAAILTTKTPESYELSRRAPEHDPFIACVRYSYIIITCLAILDQTGRIVFRLL